MAARIRTKIEIIHGHKFKMEQRICAISTCKRYFWTGQKSKQSICSIECWEAEHQRGWHREPLPRVKRPGDRRMKVKRKKGNIKTARERHKMKNEQSWKQAQIARIQKKRGISSGGLAIIEALRCARKASG